MFQFGSSPPGAIALAAQTNCPPPGGDICESEIAPPAGIYCGPTLAGWTTEPADSQLTCYAGLAGYDATIWFSDPCPVCGCTHKFYNPPGYNPADSRLEVVVICYGMGWPGVPVTFNFSPAIPATSNVLAAIAAGKVIGN